MFFVLQVELGLTPFGGMIVVNGLQFVPIMPLIQGDSALVNPRVVLLVVPNQVEFGPSAEDEVPFVIIDPEPHARRMLQAVIDIDPPFVKGFRGALEAADRIMNMGRFPTHRGLGDGTWRRMGRNDGRRQTRLGWEGRGNFNFWGFHGSGNPCRHRLGRRRFRTRN